MNYGNLNFSRRELVAILNVAYGMADIDGNTDSIESEVIYSQMTSFGITYEDLLALSEDAIVNMKPDWAMNIIAEMSHLQKQYVQALLVVIMAADGEIHDREMALLNAITVRCGLPPINMNDIRSSVKSFRNL